MKHYILSISKKSKTPNNKMGDIVKIITSSPSPLELEYFNCIKINGLVNDDINQKLDFTKRLNCNNFNNRNIENLEKQTVSKRIKLYTLGIIKQYEK